MNQGIAKKNFDYIQETIVLKSDLEMSWLTLGQRLEKIQAEKLYEPNYDTFDEFLEEIKISRSTASKLINVWKIFVFEYKIKPKLLAEAGGWSKVAELLPFVENKMQAVAWLQKAKHITLADLRKEVTEAKTGISMSTCVHEWEEVTFKRCLKCHETEKVYE